MQVVTPFLPGDSLLFAAGSLAALGHLGLLPLLGTFITAAILGDAVNYAAGQFFGAQTFLRGAVPCCRPGLTCVTDFWSQSI